VAKRPVFVSYSQHDSGTAFALVKHVEAAGVPCWVAPRDVTPGAEWAAEIVEAIAASRVMVLVLSASADRSQQVHREVERAVHRRVPVLPFRIEHVSPSRTLEYFLSTQHWLDAFPPPMEPHYARLTAHLKTLLARTGQDAEVPTGPAVAASSSLPGELRIDPAPLQRLEAELARFIGPIANHLVNRAMQRSSGVEELLEDLAREIASEAERRDFIAAARRAMLGERS
jgi:hypothetical protein